MISLTIVSCFDISIHAPAWGATRAFLRPRKSRGISIHAPAWGATRAGGLAGEPNTISIHAPAWGATYLGNDRTGKSSFQSTLPHGERQQKHEISSLFL